MSKIHYEEILQSPNESDPEGYSEILCGLESVGDSKYLTTNKSGVTCKKCLKRINTPNPTAGEGR